MKMTLLLLSALAAICYGAALPQSIVTGATLAAPEPTYTVVIPCSPSEKSCVPRTMTIEARQDFVEPTFVFPAVSQSVNFNDGTTQTAVILPRQSIVTGSATMSAPEPTYTWVIPCYPGETDCVPRTITFEARDAAPQTLGSVSRSASVPPTLPTTTTTSKKPHKSTSTKKSSSTKKISTTGLENSTKGYASRTATIYPRQSIVTASRSVDAWPWGPTVTTEIVTVTVTETETPTTTTAVPPSSTVKTTTVSSTSEPTTTHTTTAPASSSGYISRSVGTDEGSTSSGVISSAVAGSTAPVLTERDALPQVTPVLGSPSRSVDEWPWPIHTTSTVTKTVTETETVTKVSPPPPTSTSTWAPLSTPPTTTWAPTTPPGTSTVPVLTVPINRRERRQVLGSVSRSVTFDGSTPTPTKMVTTTKGWWWKDE